MKNERWMTYILAAAGLYNLAFGAFAVTFPYAWFDWAGAPRPNYPELWQCIGMIVGVYGFAYLAAAADPVRHWPVVLAGLLGKVLGPVGFALSVSRGRLSWDSGWVILTNDLLWWVPFGLILKAAFDGHLGQKRVASPEIMRMALRARTQEGMTLDEMSRHWPTLLVFLRHTGCTFCREALADIARQRASIEEQGARVVLIHMSTEEKAAPFFEKYGLGNLPRISDPKATVYRAFGLGRGGLRSLFGPKVWFRGFQAGIVAGHGVGKLEGDGFQMPGVFLLFHGEVLRAYRHQSAADRPDYVEMASIG